MLTKKFIILQIKMLQKKKHPRPFFKKENNEDVLFFGNSSNSRKLKF